MKKEFALIVLCVLMFGFVSAISSDLKESYSPMETGIVEISGQILEPISNDQVEFKRINVNVPVEYDIKKIGSKYYLWFISPQNFNNYTLIINDISTSENGVSKTVDYQKNFTVGGETSDYYIKPGFIIANNNFQIKVYSNLDSSKEITVGYPGIGNVMINPGENTLNFINDFDSTQNIKIAVGKYSVPAYILGKSGSFSENNSITTLNPSIQINPSKITSILLVGENKKFLFAITNDGDYPISGSYFEFNRSLFSIYPDERIDLEINQTQYFNLTLNRLQNINDKVYVIYNNKSYPLELRINFTDNKTAVTTVYQNNNGSVIKGNRCSEIPGAICTADEVCSLEAVQSLDGACCTGICKKAEKKSSSWIGYLIAAFLIVGMFALWFWYSKRKRPSNAFQKKVSDAQDKLPKPPMTFPRI